MHTAIELLVEMGQIPSLQISPKDVLNKPVNAANKDQFLTLSPEKEARFPIDPCVSKCANWEVDK